MKGKRRLEIRRIKRRKRGGIFSKYTKGKKFKVKGKVKAVAKPKPKVTEVKKPVKKEEKNE